MKKRCFALAALLFAALSLSACGENQIGNSDSLTLMGKRSDLNKTYLQRILDRYEEKTGNSIQLIEVEDSEYETTALQKFRDGKGPDLFLHFHNADLSRYRVEENFYYLNDESWKSDLTSGALAYCMDAEKNLLGLPFWESSISGCYYNKTLLDEMGLGAASSQADFNGLCSALSAVGQTPICWPANGCSWMLQFGLDPIFADNPDLLAKLNRNETTYLEIPAVIDMIQWISEASAHGWFGNDYLQVGWDEISEKLSSGEAVMTFIWDTWFSTDFKPGKYTADDFALMPIFMNTESEGTYEGGNLNMMMVNRKSEKRQKALEFLRFCATPENYNAAFEGISTVSVFKGQTSNIQSKMVTDAQASIAKKERVSTAATKIIGYSADEMCVYLNELFHKKITISECIVKMDLDRIKKAQDQGVEGF